MSVMQLPEKLYHLQTECCMAPHYSYCVGVATMMQSVIHYKKTYQFTVQSKGDYVTHPKAQIILVG